MPFEWDDKKAELNLKKHGLRFEDVVKAFDDPKGIELLDRGHSERERRFQLIAMADGTILFIVFTERVGAIRLISARRARSKEIEIYYGRES